MPLKLIDCFSGLGVFSYAAEKLIEGNEFKTIAFVEQDPFCQKVLRKHWKSVPIFDDIRTYNPEPYSAQVVCGGFPCTDISTAGKGLGITKETRSGLFLELMRVIRLVRPKFFILENVSAIINNGMDVVLSEIYKTGIYECEWACFPASIAVNACHQRDRFWLIGYASNSISRESRPKSKIQTGGDTLKRGIASNTEHFGSSSTEKSRSIKATNGRTTKRKNETREFKRSIESRDSKAFRGTQESTDPNSFPMERSGEEREQIKHGLCKEGLPKWGHKRILLNPDWRSWNVEPLISRINDGSASWIHRNKRIKALGNSIVAPCAAIPLQRVLELSKLEGYK